MIRTIRALLIATMLAAFTLVFAFAPIRAAAIVVDTATDVNDSDTSSIANLIATPGADGSISLREAITAANNTGGADTITFDAAIDGTPITLTSGQLFPTTDMNITGNGAGNTIIQVNTCNPITLPGGCTPAGSPVVEQTGGTLTISGVTIRYGNCAGGCNAGGIYSNSNLTLDAVVVTANKTTGDGGGILNDAGTLTIDDSTISNNSAGGEGGGVALAVGSPTFNMTDVEITDNSADGDGGGLNIDRGSGTWTRVNINGNTSDADDDGNGTYGGGIYFGPRANYTINDSSVTDNSASITELGLGGGVASEGNVTFNNSTISGNIAAGGGGAAVLDETLTLNHVTVNNNTGTLGANLAGIIGSLILTNSIVANPVGGNNCAGGTINETERNLIFGSAGSCVASVTSDPMLAGLALDGTTNTYYHALGATSGAIDEATNATCGSDQIGTVRGIDGSGILDDPQTGDCDLGAIEFPYAPPTIEKAFSPETIAIGGISTLTFMITNTGNALTGLAFSDTFPADMMVAATPNIVDTCGFSFNSGDTAGDTTLDVDSGSIAAASTCILSVNVTSSTAGTHTNTTGAITSMEVTNTDTATADLRVRNPVTSAPPSGNIETSDPAISKAGSPLNATIGEEVVWTIWVTNPGSTATDFVFVNDPIPAMFDIVDVTTTQGMANTNGQVVTVDVGTVQPGQTITIQITTVANDLAQPGEVCNTATTTNGDATACVTLFPSELPPTGGQPLINLWLMVVAAVLMLGVGGGVFALRRKTI